jgi:hypothetical protein
MPSSSPFGAGSAQGYGPALRLGRCATLDPIMDETAAVPTARGRATRVAAALALIGAALISVGAFLSWARVVGGGASVRVSWPVGYRAILVLCAALALLMSFTLWVTRERRLAVALEIVAGAIALGTGLYVSAFGEDRLLDDAARQLAARFGGTQEHVRALIEEAVDAGRLQASLGSGPSLVVLGGALCALGGIVGLVEPSTDLPTPVPAPAPSSSPPPSPAVRGGRDGPGPPPPVRDETAEGDAAITPGG